MSNVKISFMVAGYCTHPEKVAHPGGTWSSRVFPASVAVIEHPTQGVVLFDTGYSERFFTATKSFPNALYRWLTPVFLDENRTAKSQLARAGIKNKDVRNIILSHFHADHIGAVSDFPQCQYIYQEDAFAEVKALRGFSALRKAFLPSLLPNDFLERSRAVSVEEFKSGPEELEVFGGGVDLFNDGTIWMVQLPGHSEGHTGLFVRADKDYLLAGDACYVRENFAENAPSSAITRLIFSDFNKYKNSLSKLHQVHTKYSHMHVVPCHCANTMKEMPPLRTGYVAPNL